MLFSLDREEKAGRERRKEVLLLVDTPKLPRLNNNKRQILVSPKEACRIGWLFVTDTSEHKAGYGESISISVLMLP